MFYNILLSGSTTPTPNTITGIMEESGNVVSNILNWVGDIANTIVQTPLLFVGVGLFVLGAAVSFVRRLLRR